MVILLTCYRGEAIGATVFASITRSTLGDISELGVGVIGACRTGVVGAGLCTVGTVVTRGARIGGVGYNRGVRNVTVIA